MTGGHELDDLGFEELDAALRARLGATQPLALDADATLGRLRPSMERARRRHRAALAGASLLGLAAILVVGALVVRPGSGADVQTPPATRPDVASTSVPTSATTVPVTPDSVFTPPSVDDHGGSSGSGTSGSSGSGSSGSGSSGSGSSGSGTSGSGTSGSGSSGSGSSGPGSDSSGSGSSGSGSSGSGSSGSDSSGSGSGSSGSGSGSSGPD